MCAVGDLHRVHDFTQAQRADRSTRVFQRSSTPCQHNCSAHRQSNEIAAFHAYTSRCRHTRRIAHTCLVLAEIHSAQINQGSEILHGSWCAHLRHESRKEGDDLHHKLRIVLCVRFAKHKHSRVYLSHAAVTHNGVNSLNSLPRPQSCSRDIEDGLQGSRWVAAQNPHNSIWQGKPACWT